MRSGNSAPELRFTSAGKAIATLRLAENYQAREGRDADVLYISCTVFGEMAEHAAKMRKGQRVVAEGRLVTRSWETSGGEKRSATDLIVNDLGESLWFGERSASGSSERLTAVPASGPAAVPVGAPADYEVPF